MGAKTKPAPKAKKADGETKAKKPKKPRPTEVPEFLEDDGTILLVENEKGRKLPIRLKGTDFPSGVEGYKAHCDYQIASWVWKKANRGKGGDVDKRQKRLDRLREQIAKLEAELA